MGGEKKFNVKGKVVVAAVWVFVVALIYLVYLKFRVISH